MPEVGHDPDSIANGRAMKATHGVFKGRSDVEIFVYKGAGHVFHCDERGPPAAGKAANRVLAFDRSINSRQQDMPSKSIESIVQDAAEESGWDDAAVIEVLQDFIDQFADIDEFESFLQIRVREALTEDEGEAKGEDEEEER